MSASRRETRVSNLYSRPPHQAVSDFAVRIYAILCRDRFCSRFLRRLQGEKGRGRLQRARESDDAGRETTLLLIQARIAALGGGPYMDSRAS